MVTRMLIDAAHPEETRVAVVKGNRIEEFDFETSVKAQLKGNIYLAKVVRVEPSLQAAFVDYGGNRHGFLAFNEIHPDYYQIPVADRQALIAAEAEAQRREADEQQRADEHEFGGDGAPPASDADSRATASEQEFVPTQEIESGFGPNEPAPDKPSATAALAAEPSPALSEAPAEHGPEAELPPEASTGAAQESPAQADQGDDQEDEPTRFDRGRRRDRQRRGEGEGGAEGEEAPQPESLGGSDDIDEDRPRRVRLLRSYKIQEVIRRRQILLVQVVKEERGSKGAALTTYISLAGRYCVLMPNTPRGGGISRKITSAADRRRLKDVVNELEVPPGIAMIVRTAGAGRSKAEIRRDFEYLSKTWDEVRETTLNSRAPALIHAEGDLIKRSIRDVYSKDIDDVLVEGDEAYKAAKKIMRMLMPSHAKRVQQYTGDVPLLSKYGVEDQLESMMSPQVQLRSGGYVVINSTEALVAIDVNSGRATRERNIEETALGTNLEAAEEVARQLRLRDLAGLIVIDFIDMEEHRNNRAVERRLKECLKVDRARIQIGRISHFGLLEMSRQRLRPSLIEISSHQCPMCNGTGAVRSTESSALHALRILEAEGVSGSIRGVTLVVATSVSLYLLNNKRAALTVLEERYGMRIVVVADDALVPPNHRLERGKEPRLPVVRSAAVAQAPAEADEYGDEIGETEDMAAEAEMGEADAESEPAPLASGADAEHAESSTRDTAEVDGDRPRKGRRRGRRGGRRRRRDHNGVSPSGADDMIDEARPALAGAAETSVQDLSAGEPDQSPGGNATQPQGPDDGPRRRRRRRRRRGRGGEGQRQDFRSDRGPEPGGFAYEELRVAPYAPLPETRTERPAQSEPPPRAAEPPQATGRPREPIVIEREYSPPPPPERTAAPTPVAPAAADQPPKERRRGWWNRLTGN